MSERVIDPAKVLEMGKAMAKAAVDVDAKGRQAQHLIDGVSGLVGGAPDALGRAKKVAGSLAEQGGEAVRKAVKYVDDVKALEELTTWQWWMPNMANFTDPDWQKVVTSDEFGSVPIGVAAYLLEKFDKGSPVLRPGSNAPIPIIPRMDNLPTAPGQITTHQGQQWVRRPSGLIVPSGSAADPRIPPAPTNPPPGWRGVRPGVRVDVPEYRVPKWASVTSKTLGWAGAGLTVYGAGYNQWLQDKQYHPEMGGAERFARAAGNAVIEGGPAAAGAWALGVKGAAWGATAGTMIGGPVGGVIGGVVGGAVGAFVGSKAGAAVGRGLKALGKKLFG
ncbi:hypothetical protein [Thermoactinospora rubra]|uniref:hypothetical protein n=1 Tax=Thermoactinospora rubra TaxID=1088767 RepID=UPI000A11753F|nr:hypothetical protein [Thermoactinospora rubra]